MDLAERVATIKARRNRQRHDEIRSSAYRGLIRAASAAPLMLEKEFRSYAWHCIHGSVVDGYREDGIKGFKRNHKGMPRFRPLARNDQCLATEDDERETLHELIGLFSRELPAKWAAMFHLYHSHAGITHEEVGRRFGTTGGYCTRILQRSYERLRHKFSDRINELVT